MINKWILGNFKSIEGREELEFRPLTIFTGANSSGKSTVLQSILMVSQTVQSPIASRSIVLNGFFKKFGTYSDIVNRRDINKNIQIGFSISDNLEVSQEESLFAGLTRGRIRSKSTDCLFEVSSNSIVDNLQPVLENLKINEISLNGKVESLTIEKNNESSIENQKVIDFCKSRFQPSDFQYSINTSKKTRTLFFFSREFWKTIGVGLFHFLPNYVIVYTKYSEMIKAGLMEYFTVGRASYYELENDDEKMIIPIIKDKALAILDDIYTKNRYCDQKKFQFYYDSIHNKKFTIQKFAKALKFSALSEDEKQKSIKPIMDLLDNLPERFMTEKTPAYFYPGVESIKDFFTEHIKYLGPLREEPKSVYPLEGNGNSNDLGLKGENTASVYENNKNKHIVYVDPCTFEDASSAISIMANGTLAEAIDKWLVYLGVAKDMSTNDKGKFGHELKITTDIEDMKQDLTHVGVGVSQILPILVLCFLSEKGDSIILEQPELHLHPRVQTRLADFFVSMNALGKQCIIETHSEYMINRLRYLVAISDDSKISDETMMYFAEKDKTQGCSKYRQVTINKYGVIEEWPDGFFDESERIAAQILRAGMEKKMKEEGEQEYEE